MPFLSRKFSRSKWEGCDPYKPDEIPADAITSDLRTSANTLSFWICTDEEVARRDLRTTVLAMAANYERLDKIDVCWISEAEAEDAGLILNPSSGAGDATRAPRNWPTPLALYWAPKSTESILARLAPGGKHPRRSGKPCQP